MLSACLCNNNDNNNNDNNNIIKEIYKSTTLQHKTLFVDVKRTSVDTSVVTV